MKLVIDLQGAQSTSSKNRGIGRYSSALTEALLRTAGEHDIWIALNDAFPDTIEPLRAKFDALVPQDRIVVWRTPIPTKEINPENEWRRRTGEILRESFLASLAPDIVHVSSHFEGYGDNAMTSVGTYANGESSSVTLYDLIPLIHKELYLTDRGLATWYQGKLESLRKAGRWLAISEATRQEGIDWLELPPDRVVNISGAADARFRPIQMSKAEEEALRQRHELSRAFVMYTGGIDYRKNVEGLIDSYALLPAELRKHHQLAIVCAALPNAIAALKERAQNQGLDQDEIVLTGFVSDSDLVGLYNICRGFCFPSLHEGFGLPALEAMQCGAPTIGSTLTSIPEVIGRADALFDPRSKIDMASRLYQLLTDEDYRNSLANYGLRQAGNFSWEKSARRSWAAFEAQYEELRDRKRLRFAANTKSRRRLAYISPLPPERSGIADYSVELLPALARRYDIDVIVDQPNVTDAWIATNCAIRDVAWFEENAHLYDRILYHFGNSIFHRHMFDLLERHPGIVVLHDFYLSGLIAHLDLQGVSPGLWSQALYDSHGYSAVRDRFYTSDAAVTTWKYPTSLRILQRAVGTIVHSHHSCNLAERFYGQDSANNWIIVPPVHRLPVVTNREAIRRELGFSENEFVLCSFGITAPTKLNHRLIQAWLHSSLARGPNCRLVFVGETGPADYSETLQQLIDSSPAGKRIERSGYVDPDMFQRYLAAADLAVQLRTLSRGETSRSVFDCMAHGLAVIVNAHGSAAELPRDCVFMLPDEFSDAELATAMEELYADEEARKTLGGRARAYVKERLSPRRIADEYASAIERHMESGRRALIDSTAAALARIETETQDEADWLAAARAINKNLLPSTSRRQLLVDISEMVQSDAASSAREATRGILAELLAKPPAGYRVEPVYAAANNSGYHYARKFTLEFLECPQILSDAPAELKNGDIFLSLDAKPDSVLRQSEFFSELRSIGARAYFVVDDLPRLQSSQEEPDAGAKAVSDWLLTNAEGIFGTSRTAAEDFSAWLDTHGPQRTRPLKVGWIDLAAHGRDAIHVSRQTPAQNIDNLLSILLADNRSGRSPQQKREIATESVDIHSLEQVRVPEHAPALTVPLRGPGGMTFEPQDDKSPQEDRDSIVKRQRRRLAYISPLPPERSGIADYSVELLPALARRYDIDVIVDQPNVTDAWIATNCAIRDVAWFEENAHLYDRILYHFGNSIFHRHMFDLLERHPGIVVLHDFYLSGLIAHLDLQGVSPGLWSQALYDSHGYSAVRDRFYTSDAAVTTWKYPTSLRILQRAVGTIVHSHHSCNLAERFYGQDSANNWIIVPPVHRLPVVTNREAIRRELGFSENEFVLCSFGITAPTKLNHRLIQAWLHSSLARGPNCRLVFVGETGPADYSETLQQLIDSSPAGKRIERSGYVDPDMFQRYLAAADLAVQLRTLSRGETSRSVFDCMAHGLAVIVNAHGSAAELPRDCVFMLPDEFSDAELATAMEELYADEEARKTLGGRARAYVKERLSPRRIADEYASAIERHMESGRRALIDSTAAALARIETETQDEADWLAAARAINKNLLPSTSRRQLLVDISEMVQSDAASSAREATRGILAELLAKPPAGYRVEPVYAAANNSGYHYARKFTLEFLECPQILSDAPAELKNGDIFLSLDAKPDSVLRQSEFFSELRSIGARAYFVVDDLPRLQSSQEEPDAGAKAVSDWLLTNAEGIFGTSRTAAEDFSAWLDTHGPQRTRPLKVGWIDLAAHGRDAIHVSRQTPAQNIDNLLSILLADNRSGRLWIFIGDMIDWLLRRTHADDARQFDMRALLRAALRSDKSEGYVPCLAADTPSGLMAVALSDIEPLLDKTSFDGVVLDLLEHLATMPLKHPAYPRPGDHVAFAGCSWETHHADTFARLSKQGIAFSVFFEDIHPIEKPDSVDDEVHLAFTKSLKAAITFANILYVPSADVRAQIVRWSVLAGHTVIPDIVVTEPASVVASNRATKSEPWSPPLATEVEAEHSASLWPSRFKLIAVKAAGCFAKTIPIELVGLTTRAEPAYLQPIDSWITLGQARQWCTSNSPDVSIVVINWNASELTLECVRQVWANTAGIRYEIIIVDNGSSDIDLRQLRQLDAVDGIRVVKLGRNRYFGEANNIAVEHALGRFVFLLNNDAYPQFNCLNILVRALEQTHDAGAAGPLFMFPDGRIQEAGAYVDEEGTAIQIARDEKNVSREILTTRFVDYASGAALLLSRDAFLQVGGFDFVFEPVYYEDTDLCFKLHGLGKRVLFCPDAVVVHIEGASTNKDAEALARRQLYVAVNKEKFVARWGKYLQSRRPEDAREIALNVIPPSTQAAVPTRASDNRKTVAIYAPHELTSGGAERYIFTLATSLSKELAITIVLPNPYSRFRIVSLGRTLGLDLSRCRVITIDQIADTCRFDLLVCLGDNVVPPIDSFAKCGIFICQFPFPQPIKEIRRLKYRLADYGMAIVYSDYAKANLLNSLSAYQLPQIPIEVLNPPAPRFEGSARDKRDVILSIGRFFEGPHSNRHDLMIEAFKALSEIADKKLEFHLAGPSSPTQIHYLDGLKQMAAGFDIYFHVNVSVEELARLYSEAAVYWQGTGLGADLENHPEAAEAFGISIVEAMSAGCVPLAFNAGGPREIIRQGVNGFLYDSLADLIRLTADLFDPQHAETRIRIAEAAMERASAFSIDHFVAKGKALVQTNLRLAAAQSSADSTRRRRRAKRPVALKEPSLG